MDANTSDAELRSSIADLTREMRTLAQVREESNPAAKAADGGRYMAANDGAKATADELAELQQFRADKAATAEKARLREIALEIMSESRSTSKAATLAERPAQPGNIAQRSVKAHPFMSDVYGADYQAGDAISAIGAYKGWMADGIDVEMINAGKARLEELGMLWLPASDRSVGKATLGTTGATGGYVLPNNLVDSVRKPNTQKAIYRDLVTVVPGVAVRGVDQPYRMGAPSRMTSQNWGSSKENLDESYGSYTANLVTFARIYDVGKQYLRFSAGAAERDVLDELAKAADLAENFEVIAGPGSGSVGSGDACMGIYTSLNATPTFLNYKAAKTGSATSSTVVGSFVAALAEISGILAGRNRFPSAYVVDHTTYWTALAQGSDSAGFWASPAGLASGLQVDASGRMAFFGVPVLYDTNLGTNATTKILIAAEWDAFKLYRGMEFRIDSTDVAGSRWDQNLVGFRGEMEMGFNADTGVHVGAAQLMTAVIP